MNTISSWLDKCRQLRWIDSNLGSITKSQLEMVVDQDILDVARIEGKILILRKSHFDLKKLILNTIADHTSQIIREGKENNNKVKLEYAPKEGEDYNVYGDRGRLRIEHHLKSSIYFHVILFLAAT